MGVNRAADPAAGPLPGNFCFHSGVEGQDGALQYKRAETEVEAKGHSSAAHGQWPLPGQSNPDGTSSHFTVSPPDGQPVLGATSHYLSHSKWEEGEGGADSGPSLQKELGYHVCTLFVALLKDKSSGNSTVLKSTSSSCSLCLGDKSALKTF